MPNPYLRRALEEQQATRKSAQKTSAGSESSTAKKAAQSAEKSDSNQPSTKE